MPVLVFCHSPDPPPPAQQELLERFSQRGEAWLVPHLNDWPENSPLWQKIKTQTEPVLVFTSLYPLAAQWLLVLHGLTAPQVRVVSYRMLPDEGELERLVSATETNAGVCNLHEPLTPRWFPVINRDLCTNCMHCLQFCLFGVYESGSAGEVHVAHPDRCKPGCPACARVCPVGAIMFPMYERDPKIAGADVGQASCLSSSIAPAATSSSDQQQIAQAGQPSTKPPAYDDLDSLVTQMEQAMQRRS